MLTSGLIKTARAARAARLAMAPPRALPAEADCGMPRVTLEANGERVVVFTHGAHVASWTDAQGACAPCALLCHARQAGMRGAAGGAW